MIDRSALFTAYNAAKRLPLERDRLNRALGLAQRREVQQRYATTPDACTCPDALYRRGTCKHQIATVLRLVATGGVIEERAPMAE